MPAVVSEGRGLELECVEPGKSSRPGVVCGGRRMKRLLKKDGGTGGAYRWSMFQFLVLEKTAVGEVYCSFGSPGVAERANM